MFLLRSESSARGRKAENARRELTELVKAYAEGQVSRRDFIKWGLMMTGGAWGPIHDLGPFGQSAFAGDFNIPTGLPPSPLFGVRAFTQPMPRFDVLPRKEYRPGQGTMDPIPAFPGRLGPDPTEQANTTPQPVPAVLGGGQRPDRGPSAGPDLGPPAVE